MTERKDFKKVVRDRMKQTGESYTAANAALSPDDAPVQADEPAFQSLGELQRAAYLEARRLGHKAMGPEHALLAILHGSPSERARRALETAGLTPDLVEGIFGPEWEGGFDGGLPSNPAWNTVSGRAEGFGFAQNEGTPAVNFVMAMLWDKDKWSRWDAQVPRERVIEALRREGVSIPVSPPPQLASYDTFTQKVDVPLEHLDRVVEVLARRHREEGGPRIGFNHDGTNGFVISEDGIDLQAVVDEIIRTDA